MKRTKQLAFAIALTFIAGLIWSAQAQNRLSTVKGIEVSPGTEDAERGVMNGASFLGKSTGMFPGSLFLAFTHTSSPPSFANVPTEDGIKEGTWSLPVYRGNQYLGAIYGLVAEGMLRWNSDKTVANVDLTLSIEGGTQTYARARGKGYFVGKLDRTTRGKPTLNGTLELQF